MKLVFLLDRPELGGGVKVVFQLAGLAAGVGHEVSVAGRGPRPSWSTAYFHGPYEEIACDGWQAPPRATVVATYWTTIPVAMASGAARVVHYCQGFEGDLEHLAGWRTEIESVYREPLPALVVNPILGARLARAYGKRWAVVPPPMAPEFLAGRVWWRPGPRRPARILVPGHFGAPVKGVKTALAVVARLRENGVRCQVVRLSPVPAVAEEIELAGAAEFHHGVTPDRVPRLMSGCDVLLFASGPAEGFGLPVLEAAATGLPVVGFDGPAMRMVGHHESQRVAPGDVDAMFRAADELLTHSRAWRASRKIPRLRARVRFHPALIRKRFFRALRALFPES